jgi:uncharacterized membrane protein YhdT
VSCADTERNYSFDEIEVDPRFKRCEFEMKLTFAVWIAYALISIGLSYFLGRGEVTKYVYVFGVPLWVAVGAWLTTAVFLVIVVFITTRIFQDMDLMG